MRLFVIGLLILFLSGCLQPETAFQFTDISSPCSVVASGEVRALYDFKAIKETPFSKEDEHSFCMYSGQTTENGSNLLTRHQLILMYTPHARSNESIMEDFRFENETESAFILEKNLGFGDQSFLALRWNKKTKKILHMSVVVLANNSAIIATDAGYQMSGVDIKNKDKLKELAKLALERLAK